MKGNTWLEKKENIYFGLTPLLSLTIIFQIKAVFLFPCTSQLPPQLERFIFAQAGLCNLIFHCIIG